MRSAHKQACRSLSVQLSVDRVAMRSLGEGHRRYSDPIAAVTIASMSGNDKNERKVCSQMTNTTQSNVEGIAVDVSAFAKHAEAVFKQLVEQTAIQTRPQRRQDSLATLKRLGVVTEVEADTIGTILANGDGSAQFDIDKIVAAIDVARNRTSSPATSAILQRHECGCKKWSVSEPGDGCQADITSRPVG